MTQSIRWLELSPSHFKMCIIHLGTVSVEVPTDELPGTLRPCTCVCAGDVKRIGVKLRPWLSYRQDLVVL